MTVSGAQPEPTIDEAGRVATARVAAARSTVTAEKVEPASESALSRIASRAKGEQRGDKPPAREPFPVVNALRVTLTLVLAVLCLLTVGGAVLLLLLWQQSRDTGVLTSQLDRTWDLLDLLQDIERYVAFAAIPIAMAWIALAAINVGRGTGNSRNPVLASLSLPVGLIGAWLIGREVIGGSDDAITQAAGYVLQITLLTIPLLFLERVAIAADARRRPLRATYLIGAAYLAHMEFLGGLSTIDRDTTDGDWGTLGAYLLIGALLQVIGTLSANEACRSIEDATQHRYQLRSRFSESLLAQAELQRRP
ncbi:hypothetical protein BDK89_1153 [Ilumatobacter fluminis]|uniref:Uncharacterized protein n=1 Tax=Ilumatobacter fluminis TaxID=467091 RepID=A0A4R7HXW4_9ACTN|nr:hypothetical protein [Ilumatobacter fluminis]TDT15580.1 hypothetical protein BDK89_1153 [Ilumatobacter fluminis]